MSFPFKSAALAAVLVASFVACGGEGDPASPPGGPDALSINSIVVEDAVSGEVMFSHDDHWHGFPIVSVGGRRELRVYFVKQGRAPDDHDIPPRNEWISLSGHPDHALPVVIEDPTRARWEGDRAGGALIGQAVGASRLNIRVLRGTTTVWEAPPLNFTIRQ
ncbi:MAG: hypothetical protein IBJ03_05335 [Gemmatimonadaceae bacterium]|nr:hypothetical protein [Gemmatimonadaceae bacterium]